MNHEDIRKLVEDRKKLYSRQSGILDPSTVADTKVTIIGIGSIGRNIAVQLVSMGITHFHLIDFDKVDLPNVASQGYLPSQVGALKTYALRETIKQINPEARVDIHSRPYLPQDATKTPFIFVAVDTITVRQEIWKTLVKKLPEFYCDCRMAAEACRIITLSPHTQTDTPLTTLYEKTLFPEEETYVAPCNVKATIYCSSITASIAVSQLSKHIRKIPLPADITYNMLTSEFFVE